MIIEVRSPRPSKNKASVLKAAKSCGRRVLWKDEKGKWHAATNRANTPRHAIETEDIV